ncbi:uncharacterized protein [Haliotis asinina]|uniref:uncharacterized protein n=1 Tax=Haliotis asinina TaxID=109174 RepID=UPI0035321D7F
MALRATIQCGPSTWRPRSRNRSCKEMEIHTVQGSTSIIRSSSFDIFGRSHILGDLSQLRMLIVSLVGCVLFYMCLMFCMVILDRQICTRKTHIGRKVKHLLLHLLKMPHFVKTCVIRSIRVGWSMSRRWCSTLSGMGRSLQDISRHLCLEFYTCLALEITPLFVDLFMFPIHSGIKVYGLICEALIMFCYFVKNVCAVTHDFGMTFVSPLKRAWVWAGSWKLKCGCHRNNLKRAQVCSNQ